ncbi:MAG: hypothetical protein MUE48_09695, partial [Desulfobacterales bacterium]|nr:hypothetical protein [Desulfobacterales bacterium]
MDEQLKQKIGDAPVYMCYLGKRFVLKGYFMQQRSNAPLTSPHCSSRQRPAYFHTWPSGHPPRENVTAL